MSDTTDGKADAKDKPTGSGRRRAGLIGAVIGVAAAGVAAGVAVERLVVKRSRNRQEGDPFADEPFGRLPYDETLTVSTDDGVQLHVEIVEPVDGIAVEMGDPGPP